MRELSQQVVRSDTTARAGLVVGRGQVNPDPSHFPKRLRGGSSLAILVVMTVAAVSRFVFGTLLADSGDPVVTTAATALSTAIALVLAGSSSSAGASWKARHLASGTLGALVAAVVPYLWISHQHSDAPSGTLVLFWSAVVPGALLLVAGARARMRVRAVLGALSLAAVMGGAGVLGNWERPSSFSLLARHVPQQLWIGTASLMWVAGLVALAWLARSGSWHETAKWAGAGALVAGVASLVAGGDPLGSAAALLDPTVGAFALSSAVVTVAALLLAFRGPVTPAASGLLLAPSALSLLVLVEAAVGVLGPEPILRTPVMWSSALVLAAHIAAYFAEEPHVAAFRSHALRAVLAAAGALAAVAAAAGLLAPALGVEVQGRMADASRFAAEFSMRGFETVGGWSALAVTALALAVALWRPGRRAAVSSAVVGLVGAGAWWIVGRTPLHTWVTWIPPDVQQDYGTEYASIVFEPLTVAWQTVAVGVAVAVLLVAAAEALRVTRETAEPVEESETP